MADSERKTSENMDKVMTVNKLDSAIGKIENVIERSERIGMTDEEEEVLELCITDLEKYKERKIEEWNVMSHTNDEEDGED